MRHLPFLAICLLATLAAQAASINYDEAILQKQAAKIRNGLGGAAKTTRINYAAMARELEQSSRDKAVVKIAVLPFEEIGVKDSPLGRSVEEELTFALVKYTKFNVLERSLVNRALSELAFQRTGAIDAASVRKIGMGVGAEAVVSGTVQKNAEGELRVIARLIKTETFDILAVASSDYAAGRFVDQPGSSPVPVQTAAKTPPPKEPGYFELFSGYLLPAAVNLKFGNETNGVNSQYAGVPGTAATYSLIEYRDLSAQGGYPFGLRVRPATPYVQLVAEFLYRSYAVSKQTAQVAFNGGTAQSVALAQDPFYQIYTYEVNAILTFSYKLAFFEPYAGGGIGAGFYRLKSASIYSNQYKSGVATFQPGLDTLTLGVSATGLVGARLHLTDTFGVFVEGRYTTALASYSRDIENETDLAAFKGYGILSGIALKF